MEWGGICGSDLSYWRHGSSGTAVLTQPLVLGHEVAGRIAAIGAGCTGPRSGSRSPSTRPSSSATGACPSGSPGGPTSTRGSATSARRRSTRTPTAGSASCGGRADQIRPLPDGVSTEHGALAEPLAVALHAVTGRATCAAATCSSTAPGPIGSLVVAAAKYRGAATVVAADLRRVARRRQGHGRRRGPQPRGGDTLPEDVELVFEASGAPAALGNVLRATARGGTLVQVGNLPGTPVSAVLGDLGDPGDHLDRLVPVRRRDHRRARGDGRRAGRVAADHPPVRPRRGRGRLPVAADRTTGSSKVMLRLG